MSRWIHKAASVGMAGLALALAACWQPVPQICPSQGTAPCTCEDGSAGVVTCFSDGTGYGACVCPVHDGGHASPDAGMTTDAGDSADGGSPTGDGGDSFDGGSSLDGGDSLDGG